MTKGTGQLTVTDAGTSVNPFLYFNVTSIEEMQDKWAKEELTYKGNNLFKLYNESKRIERAALSYEESNNFNNKPEFWDDVSFRFNNSDWSKTQGQEQLLMYYADKDEFVSGWDLFPEDGLIENVEVYFRMTSEGGIIINDVNRGNYSVYHDRGCYNMLKTVPNRLDIRLD